MNICPIIVFRHCESR